jgi:hypothetical protein
LTTVLEGAHDKLRSGSLNVDILSDDTGVVTSKLKSHTLEGLAASCHDLLSCSNATSETDLGNAGVLGKHRTKLVIATEDLNDTGREDGLSQLNCLQRGVGSERRGLDDDCASGEKSRSNLAERKDKRELKDSISKGVQISPEQRIGYIRSRGRWHQRHPKACIW